MVSRSGVRKCLLAGLLSGLLIGCGTKRSNKFSGSCSSLNAVGDLGSAAPKTVRMDKGEKYDPSSVILHFKAHSEKISIESRCNARLMHTLSVNNVAAPVDFSAVTFQLSAANQNALELHTSAHCFFRVWDPRDVKQLDNNHELAAADVKKILSDDAERYYLYKSLLASPQKLYAFSASGEPIEFEYKLKNATGIYAQFFEQIEGLNESSKKSAQEYVGREFSKTSFMLDELALDVCSADEKLLKRAEPAFRAMCTSDATIAQQIKFLKDDRFSVDFLRRKSIHNGKHKACISQSDLVVAPIVLTGLLTAKHAELINAIHSQQNEKMVQFKSKLTMSTDLNPPADSGTKRDRFVSEFYRGTPPSSMGSTCAWNSSYPAISMSHPTFLKVGEMMDEWKPISEELVREGMQQVKKHIPETCSVHGLLDLDLTPYVSELQKSLKEEACEMRGRSFNRKASGGAGECQSLRTIESDADA
ncbi:MAG: hypothetical protein RJB13_2340, partial [Pseudomonadota bacterium]